MTSAGVQVADEATTTVVVTGESEVAAGPVGTLGVEAIGVVAEILPVDREEVGATGVLLLPDSPLPGARGNAVIAGSRATDGHVFLRLDELAVGDAIEVALPDGELLTFRIDVGPQSFPEQEQGERLADLADEAEPRLTLVTYGPVYSATERLLVSALLEAEEPAGTDGSGGTG